MSGVLLIHLMYLHDQAGCFPCTGAVLAHGFMPVVPCMSMQSEFASHRPPTVGMCSVHDMPTLGYWLKQQNQSRGLTQLESPIAASTYSDKANREVTSN